MLHSFLQYLQGEKRYSQHTIHAYMSDIGQLADYLQIKDLQQADHRQLRGWYSELLRQGLSTRSVNRKITSVSTFFKYLVREQVLQQNPVEKVVNPKNSKRLPFFYKEEQLKEMLDAEVNEGSYEQCRNHAMIELFYGTGMRLSELVGLTISSVSLSNQTVKVLGKGNKQRIIPLSPHLQEVLVKYLEVLKSSYEALPKSSLFLTKKGEPVYPGLVYRVVHRRLAEQGVSGKKSPHVLRHSFATHMLNKGSDLNSIKELLGHTSLSATQVYTHNNIEKLLKSYRNAHPHA
ncbi:MAG: tyrosine-type recombinase/integrase [Prevotellaceae bacterium]|jgi:integrase/recombinase XerC|nr:tyrosine-type recombinase/integrase [Prevotellaceae bacterium]